MSSVALLGCSLLFLGCAASASSTTPRIPDVSAYKVKQPDVFPKVIHVDKIANKMLGTPAPTAAEDKGASGTRTRLLWRKKWNWTNDEHVFNRDLNLGLRGGPILSVEASLPGKMSAVSVQTQIASFRYTLPENHNAAAPDEILRERDNKQSVEAGLYVNFTFGK